MAIKEIVTHPSAYLRKKSAPVKKRYLGVQECQDFIDDMIDTMIKHDGIGLAAPQVAKNLNIIVALDGKNPLVFINPKLYRFSWGKVEVEEGCLSIPGVWGKVNRHRAVSVVALDRKGKRIRMRAKGMLAVILQHEVDHINGVLFIDKAKNIQEPLKM
ncbi:peptide deformylase [Candidatus Saccharibacteria bacterium]|nr:peptide deformylase [Candidatus Saccharibacteria bacterium]NIV03578.1 peptide deformylase [Calditrichia bacterium]NIS38125.1 peptide deformylase [Candidatus Saccharibacteria bacterium]NIV71858.1 peptide deformylase [Calditrichia bacterium]NIV98020.1 peptide deformylase [Candidatus Saccharibacteria bacterium]